MKVIIEKNSISLNSFLGKIVLDLDCEERSISVALNPDQAREIALILFDLADEKEKTINIEEQRGTMFCSSLSIPLNDDKRQEWIAENFVFEDIIKRYKSKNNGRLYTEKEVKNLYPKE